MISLITGKSGSGKSYKVISDILSILDNRKVITNIEMNIEHPNYIYKNEGDLKDYILDISKLFEDVKDFPRLVNSLRDKEFFNVDFYIDECHLVGFRKKTEGLINWLSVRRHLNQSITLITQTLKKIDLSYIPDIHYHTEMIAQNKRINQSMIGWKKFDEVGGDKIETKYITPNKEIFEIYKSGKVESSPNVFVRKLFGLVALLIFVLVLVYVFFIEGMNNVNNEDSLSTVLNTDTVIVDTVSDTNLSVTFVEPTETVCGYYVARPKNWIYSEKLKNGYYCCTIEKDSNGSV